MKKFTSIAISLVMVFSLTIGCKALQNANNTQKGAGIGAASGAAIGGIIGSSTGNTALGAILGAAIGGAAGGLIGNHMDKQADKIEAAVPGAEVNRVGEGIHVIFDDRSGVNFAFDSDNLTPEAKENLEAIAEVLAEFPDTDLFIEGHTDSVGNDEYNMNLSQKRAQSVVNYLVSDNIAKDRFSVVAFGETKPRFDNATKDGQAKNRRVEIGISANEELIEDARAKAN